MTELALSRLQMWEYPQQPQHSEERLSVTLFIVGCHRCRQSGETKPLPRSSWPPQTGSRPGNLIWFDPLCTVSLWAAIWNHFSCILSSARLSVVTQATTSWMNCSSSRGSTRVTSGEMPQCHFAVSSSGRPSLLMMTKLFLWVTHTSHPAELLWRWSESGFFHLCYQEGSQWIRLRSYLSVHQVFKSIWWFSNMQHWILSPSKFHNKCLKSDYYYYYFTAYLLPSSMTSECILIQSKLSSLPCDSQENSFSFGECDPFKLKLNRGSRRRCTCLSDRTQFSGVADGLSVELLFHLSAASLTQWWSSPSSSSSQLYRRLQVRVNPDCSERKCHFVPGYWSSGTPWWSSVMVCTN